MSEKEEKKRESAAESEEGKSAPEGYDMDLLLDIPLTISVAFGKVKILVGDLLQLGQGSIVELNQSVGDPLEVNVNDKLIAKGEVVVLENRFGIRLTDIISPQERVKSLG